jgi:hypothetical protein
MSPSDDAEAGVLEPERLRRLRAHWDSDAPSPSELSRLRLRLLRDAQRPRRGRAIGGPRATSFALGALLATGTTLAALGGSALFETTREQNGLAIAPSDPQQAPPPALPKARQQPAVAHPEASARPEQRGEPQTTATEASTVASEERAARPQTKSARVPSRAPQPSPPEPSGSAVGWSHARDALQKNDLPAAEKALGELMHAGDAFSRDSAALSLAELHLKQGRQSQARPLLERLSREGQTTAIRARARALLSP